MTCTGHGRSGYKISRHIFCFDTEEETVRLSLNAWELAFELTYWTHSNVTAVLFFQGFSEVQNLTIPKHIFLPEEVLWKIRKFINKEEGN